MNDIARECHLLGGVWDRLLEEVRGLLEFENFLKSVPFANHLTRPLLDSGGRIIIINASEYEVDALIFEDAKPIHRIPDTDYDFKLTRWNRAASKRYSGPATPLFRFSLQVELP